jgi:hypothetical protein
MSVRAHPNPRKTNKFHIYLEGYNVALANEVKLPEPEIQTDEHAAPGDVMDLATPGGIKYGDMTLKEVEPADAPHTFWDDWMKRLVDPESQAIGDIESNARVITVTQLGIDNVPLESHSYMVFPTKKSKPEFKGGSDGKDVIAEITLKVLWPVEG